MQVNYVEHIDCMEGFKRIKDNSIDLILTDIPYGNVTKNGAERAKYKGQLRNIDKGAADVVTFDLINFLDECYRVTKGSIYIFCGIEQVSTIFTYFDKKKDFMVRLCAWRKTNPSPANGQHMWLSTIENCVFAKKRGTKFYAHCKPSVWDYPVSRNKYHPTQKPLPLFKYLIESSTDKGDLVLDPCIGSGTTAVAAKELGRNYIGFEIEKKYVDICNKRLSEVKEMVS